VLTAWGPVVARDDYPEPAALFEALGRPDVVTVEKEHVSVALLEGLAEHCLVAPSPEAIRICQHRGREKTALQNLGISTAPFQLVEDGPSLITAVKALGYPAFVKSCEQGYDGQNQWLLRDPESLEALAAQMDSLPPLVVEGAVHFDRELSMIAARSVSGETALYPLAENRHREGILLTSEVPAANISEETQAQANHIARTLLEQWSYVGVLSIELFDEGRQASRERTGTPRPQQWPLVSGCGRHLPVQQPYSRHYRHAPWQHSTCALCGHGEPFGPRTRRDAFTGGGCESTLVHEVYPQPPESGTH
jgi:5-(carboxyamino)imidazole ribonucleotide synthase